jgi:hypothetical protein
MSSVVPVDLSHRFGTVGLAWSIVPENRHQDFLADGDSGSVILLKNQTMVSYMQLVDLVVADVEKVTRSKWAFPAYREILAGEDMLED